MFGQETVPAINANIAAHLSRPRDPPVGSLVVKELQRDMLAHAEQQRLAGAAPCAAPGAATADRAEQRMRRAARKVLRPLTELQSCPCHQPSRNMR
jgi:hypothetical protein